MMAVPRECEIVQMGNWGRHTVSRRGKAQTGRVNGLQGKHGTSIQASETCPGRPGYMLSMASAIMAGRQGSCKPAWIKGLFFMTVMCRI